MYDNIKQICSSPGFLSDLMKQRLLKQIDKTTIFIETTISRRSITINTIDKHINNAFLRCYVYLLLCNDINNNMKSSLYKRVSNFMKRCEPLTKTILQFMLLALIHVKVTLLNRKRFTLA